MLTPLVSNQYLDPFGAGNAFSTTSKNKTIIVVKLVGAAGFEPTTPCPPDKCATGLRYAPTFRVLGGFRIISKPALSRPHHPANGAEFAPADHGRQIIARAAIWSARPPRLARH